MLSLKTQCLPLFLCMNPGQLKGFAFPCFGILCVAKSPELFGYKAPETKFPEGIQHWQGDNSPEIVRKQRETCCELELT